MFALDFRVKMNKKDAFEADNAKQYETFFDSTVAVDIIVQFS